MYPMWIVLYTDYLSFGSDLHSFTLISTHFIQLSKSIVERSHGFSHKSKTYIHVKIHCDCYVATTLVSEANSIVTYSMYPTYIF